MATSCQEVWATESNLLCFDGHVLEVFGLVDNHRFHVAMGLKIEVSEGRHPRCKIMPKRGPTLSIFCDRDRIEALRDFAKIFDAGAA